VNQGDIREITTGLLEKKAKMPVPSSERSPLEVYSFFRIFVNKLSVTKNASGMGSLMGRFVTGGIFLQRCR
jgi:hypothetical protein